MVTAYDASVAGSLPPPNPSTKVDSSPGTYDPGVPQPWIALVLLAVLAMLALLAVVLLAAHYRPHLAPVKEPAIRIVPAAPTSGAQRPPTGAPGPAGTARTADQQVVVLAQRLARALAENRWADVRAITPTQARTDESYEAEFHQLDTATVYAAGPATAGSAGTYQLRLGIVEQLSPPAGARTIVECTTWQIDLTTQTIVTAARRQVADIGHLVEPASQQSLIEHDC